MNMRKIIAVLAAALMLCTIIPMGALSVSAATAVYSEDFEGGTLGTWSSSAGGTANVVAAADLPVANPNGGNYAMQTIVEAGQYPYLSDSTPFSVEPNTDYVIKVDVLHTTNNWPVEVIIGGNSWLQSALCAFRSGAVSVSNTAWTTLTFVFNTGDKSTVYMGVKSSYASATVYFDNISVTKADAAVVGTSDGYIYNGDFETGASTPWSMGNNASIVADPTDSGRGYVVKADEAGSGVMLFSQVANNLKANTYYKLSFKVYGYNTATNNAFWVRFPNTVTDWSVDLSAASGMTSQSVNAYTPRINLLGKTGAWYDLSITFNTGDLTSALITFLNYRAGNGQYYFDNIKIREVQDPSFDGFITNGDFETGDLTGWTVGSAKIAEENGNYILQGTATKKYGNFAHQIVDVKANTDYAISFKAKAAAASGQARLYAGTGTGNTGYKNSSYYWSVNNTAWTNIVISFNSGDNTQLYINLCQGIDNGGDIFYDDIMMWEVKPASNDGYITNGDFETGVPNNWKFSQSTAGVAAEAAYEGNFGANLKGNGSWGGLMSTSFATEAGETYEISFWYKAISRGVNYSVKDTDNNGEKLTSGYISATSWTKVTKEFTALSGTTHLNFNGPGETSADDDEQVYVDNIVITKLVTECTHSYDNACDTTCNDCGEIREVPAHSYREEIPVQPSCTDTGVRVFTCVNCGHMYTETIDALGHTPGAAADCDSAQVCEICGIELAPALGHTPGAAADCDSAQVCEICGIELAPALGHTPGAAADCENAQVCTVCGEVLNAALGHSWIDATCTEPKTCSVCGITDGEAAGHNYNGVVTEPTCEAGGYTTYTCSVCGDSYVGDYTEALPHTYDNEYDVDCNVCGAIREVEMPVATGGTSASEDVRGVAAKFDIGAVNMALVADTATTADYTTATVNGYKLISMGAIADNGVSTKDIAAVYLCDLAEDSAAYAVRVINIPEGKEGVEITFTPYFTVEIDGEATTIYGDAVVASYNSVIGG